MAKMIQDAYVVAAVRTPVGKAPRGQFRRVRPDDLLAHAIRAALARVPGLDPAQVGDVIVGCAMPEAEQGMNVARIATLLAGLPDSVPAMTVNRFCASGLEAVGLAANRIRTGEADVVIAGGTESMSMIPMGGHKLAMNPSIFGGNEHLAIAYGMGATAERVAAQWKVSREAQDAFALESHRRAVAAAAAGHFQGEIAAFPVASRAPDLAGRSIRESARSVGADEGPRADTTLEALGGLKPAFKVGGSVTAGNSSQMSDGAAAVVLMSEKAMTASGVRPLARFAGYAVAGVPPEIMGIGPIKAIPKALAASGLALQDMDWVELNEAFAAQALAVMGELGLDPARVNPQGGAIALGHPLGATGAIRVATLLSGLRRTRGRYGMVSMCIGTGMGAAGVFEAVA